jgi:D-arabinose 1-dehydrogenase-like Zn-dependent alcohol dehydrogenase
MARMKVAQVPKAGAEFEIVEREIPQPDTGEVRIRVQACGVCHSDVLTKEGGWPGLAYPRVPGHEVAGVIDEVGPRVTAWTKGQHGEYMVAPASALAGDARIARSDASRPALVCGRDDV